MTLSKRGRPRRRGLVLALLAGVALVPAAAAAAPSPRGTRAAPSSAPATRVKVVYRADGRKTYVFQRMVIHGRFHRPQVQILMPRAQRDFTWSQLGRDFAPKIVESVRRAPF